jgi:UDP-N-acetylglucosamine/UDP-N-acetyl-alpha-D-glucosaminouronate 4-epimerase
MSDRALVTGGAGFIGSNLCRRLVAEGFDVVALDDLSDGSLDNLEDVQGVRFVSADLRDEAAVLDAARGCSAIFHQGAKRSVPRSMVEPGLTADVNAGGTLNVLLAAREAGAVVVSASSSSVYGDQDEFPLRESMSLLPRSPYAASKLAAEVYCAGLWRSHGVPAVSLRYFNVYGPRQDRTSDYAAVIPRFIVACLTGTRPVIYGDGEQARDFTYVDDVVEANLLASRAGEDAFGKAFNIGSGHGPTSVNRLLEVIAASCGVQPDPIHEPPRPGDVRRSDGDISLARRLLGFESRVDLAEGLHRTVDWFARPN